MRSERLGVALDPERPEAPATSIRVRETRQSFASEAKQKHCASVNHWQSSQLLEEHNFPAACFYRDSSSIVEHQ